jgi:hypothetical protein
LSDGNLIKALSILSGLEIESYEDIERIRKSGFYYRTHMIEHWSPVCGYTRLMSMHAKKNSHGLLCDGFIMTLGEDDIEALALRLKNWAEHLKRYGVEV